MEYLWARRELRLSPGPTPSPAVPVQAAHGRLTSMVALDVHLGPLRGQRGAQQGRQALHTHHQGHGSTDHLGRSASQLPLTLHTPLPPALTMGLTHSVICEVACLLACPLPRRSLSEGRDHAFPFFGLTQTYNRGSAF